MGTFEDIALINTGIYETLLPADSELAIYSQNYDAISEGIINLPLYQVYWQNGTVGAAVDRATYRGGVRISDLTFHVDLFVDARSHSDKIFSAIFPLLNSIDEILASQDTKPYFGVLTADGNPLIKSYQYSYERATFVYEQGTDVNRQYPGVRFIINTRVF